MQQTSSVNTLAATTGMGTAMAYIEWLANSKMGLAMPPEVVVGTAAVLVPTAHFLVNAVNTLWTMWLAKQAAAAPQTVVTLEAGFARVGAMLASVAIAMVALPLSGCSGMNQAVAGYEKSDKVYVQTANDNIIQGIEDSICDVPFGAVVRHAEFIPTVKAQCLQGGTAASATTGLLPDAVPAADQSSTQAQLSAVLQALQTLQASVTATNIVAPVTTVPQAVQKVTVKKPSQPVARSAIAEPGSPGATVPPISGPVQPTVAPKQRTLLSTPVSP